MKIKDKEELNDRNNKGLHREDLYGMKLKNYFALFAFTI